VAPRACGGGVVDALSCQLAKNSSISRLTSGAFS
jgi:hypothetical protein